MLKKTQQSFNSTFKPRASGLCKESRNRRRAKAAQSKAYAAADDAEQVWCGCCGKPGPTEHSHHFSQKQQSHLRNEQQNWLVMGHYCGCHALFENNKAAFAAKWPKAWARIVEQMRELDPKAFAEFELKNAHLLPGGPLSLSSVPD